MEDDDEESRLGDRPRRWMAFAPSSQNEIVKSTENPGSRNLIWIGRTLPINIHYFALDL
jgi:hypothetical protein